MSQTLTQIATISLIFIAIAFYLAGFLCFRVAKLTESNSTSTYGTLVGFRRYYTTNKWGSNFVDYDDNKAGRVPVIALEINGENVAISAARGYYSLTKDDIGKRFKVRYRQFIGITMIIDDAQTVKNYNQLQNILFWTFMSVATILLAIGFLAHMYMPRVLGSMIS